MDKIENNFIEVHDLIEIEKKQDMFREMIMQKKKAEDDTTFISAEEMKRRAYKIATSLTDEELALLSAEERIRIAKGYAEMYKMFKGKGIDTATQVNNFILSEDQLDEIKQRVKRHISVPLGDEGEPQN